MSGEPTTMPLCSQRHSGRSDQIQEARSHVRRRRHGRNKMKIEIMRLMVALKMNMFLYIGHQFTENYNLVHSSMSFIDQSFLVMGWSFWVSAQRLIYLFLHCSRLALHSACTPRGIQGVGLSGNSWQWYQWCLRFMAAASRIPASRVDFICDIGGLRCS